MKNIHVLPTDKPSRLWAIVGSKKNTEEYVFGEHYMPSTIIGFRSSNMYITSDEEIKKGDWYWLEKIGKTGSESGAYKSRGTNVSKLNTLAFNCKKIILTTDQDLIKEGVQGIDDDFLEWFVNNPSCEEVSVRFFCCGQIDGKCNPQCIRKSYEIIIPKEEPINHPNPLSNSLNNKANKQEFEFLNGFIPTSFFDKQQTLEEVSEITDHFHFMNLGEEAFIKNVAENLRAELTPREKILWLQGYLLGVIQYRKI